MNARIKAQIENAAVAWLSLGTKSLNGEWTETAYTDLPSADQKEISWSDFHDAIQVAVNKLGFPEDGWVQIADLIGDEADDQIESSEFYSNNGESVTADVFMEDGKPRRLSVSNSQYVGGGFAEEAFAKYFPTFELQNNWDCPDGDSVVCTVSSKNA